jgi:Leucine-rich repeat (LRR) protein
LQFILHARHKSAAAFLGKQNLGISPPSYGWKAKEVLHMRRLHVPTVAGLLLVFVVLVAGCVNPTPTNTPTPAPTLIADVVFVDSLLAECVRATGVTYTNELTELSCSSYGIQDLSGIENLTELSELGLFLNKIRDVSPLGHLTNLVFLQLGRNHVADVSPLSSLLNLKTLLMPNNSIEDMARCGR